MVFAAWHLPLPPEPLLAVSIKVFKAPWSRAGLSAIHPSIIALEDLVKSRARETADLDRAVSKVASCAAAAGPGQGQQKGGAHMDRAGRPGASLAAGCPMCRNATK